VDGARKVKREILAIYQDRQTDRHTMQFIYSKFPHCQARKARIQVLRWRYLCDTLWLQLILQCHVSDLIVRAQLSVCKPTYGVLYRDITQDSRPYWTRDLIIIAKLRVMLQYSRAQLIIGLQSDSQHVTPVRLVSWVLRTLPSWVV